MLTAAKELDNNFLHSEIEKANQRKRTSSMIGPGSYDPIIKSKFHNEEAPGANHKPPFMSSKPRFANTERNSRLSSEITGDETRPVYELQLLEGPQFQ